MASETNSAALSAAALRAFPGITEPKSTAPYRSPVPGKLRLMCSFLMTKRSRPEPAQPIYLPSARPVTTALGASVSSSSASA